MLSRLQAMPIAGGLALLLTVGACASGSGGGGSGGSSNALTGERLIETRQGNLHDAIQSLRPRWLRARGAATLTGRSEVQVFLNGSPYGGIGSLSSIPLDAVRDVRFMSASEAGSRYGTAAGNAGVLLVRTTS